ncbi:MAG: hypothetical protein R3C45_00190 [Phycisphaerales bacterium]
MEDLITKFGDRCSFMDPDEMEEAWRRYKAHLKACGITDDEPVYRYFVNERFHDSELQFELFDAGSKSLVMAMYDIVRMDDVTAAGVPRDFNREDFLTQIRFKDVQIFSIDVHGLRGKIEYYLSEVDRQEDVTQITMYIRGQNMHDRTGVLTIRYGGLEIEDIEPRLSRRYGCGTGGAQ